MFKQIGKAHGVRPAKVFESLGRNPAGIDLAVTRPFILWYGFAATVMARHVWCRYPPKDGWTVGVAMIVAAPVECFWGRSGQR